MVPRRLIADTAVREVRSGDQRRDRGSAGHFRAARVARHRRRDDRVNLAGVAFWHCPARPPAERLDPGRLVRTGHF